jgi:hypothetical protein
VRLQSCQIIPVPFIVIGAWFAPIPAYSWPSFWDKLWGGEKADLRDSSDATILRDLNSK